MNRFDESSRRRNLKKKFGLFKWWSQMVSYFEKKFDYGIKRFLLFKNKDFLYNLILLFIFQSWKCFWWIDDWKDKNVIQEEYVKIILERILKNDAIEKISQNLGDLLVNHAKATMIMHDTRDRVNAEITA